MIEYIASGLMPSLANSNTSPGSPSKGTPIFRPKPLSPPRKWVWSRNGKFGVTPIETLFQTAVSIIGNSPSKIKNFSDRRVYTYKEMEEYRTTVVDGNKALFHSVYDRFTNELKGYILVECD